MSWSLKITQLLLSLYLSFRNNYSITYMVRQGTNLRLCLYEIQHYKWLNQDFKINCLAKQVTLNGDVSITTVKFTPRFITSGWTWEHGQISYVPHLAILLYLQKYSVKSEITDADQDSIHSQNRDTSSPERLSHDKLTCQTPLLVSHPRCIIKWDNVQITRHNKWVEYHRSN